MKILYSHLYRTIRKSHTFRDVISSSCRSLDSFANANSHQYRYSSSTLLGHSPMANAVPVGDADTSKKKKRGDFGTIDAETALKGGVWAQTSAKRDKIVELKAELKEDEFTLDDAATSVQKLDLDLADGMKVLMKAKDEGWEDYLFSPVFQELLDWFDESEKVVAKETKTLCNVNKTEFEAYLTDVIRRADKIIQISNAPAALAIIRDFMEPPRVPTATSETSNSKSSLTESSDEDEHFGTTSEQKEIIDSAFKTALQLYQALLLKSVSEHLISSWETLTTITDGDMDRAATKGLDPPEIKTLSLKQVNTILKTYLNGTCHDSVKAWWDLLDYDQDGLLDETQMAEVAEHAIRPFHKALPTFFVEAVEAHPVTLPLSPFPIGTATSDSSSTLSLESNLGWRQKRREKKSKNNLLKLFSKTLERHFELEAEAPHRLRCIYAWAEKSHQKNKIESVLLDTGADNTVSIVVGGKKRYVELHPKISYSEFLIEQRDHFKQLDQVGQEILGSFKEDLHVQQGKGRQNAELRREMGIFFALVVIADAAIYMV